MDLRPAERTPGQAPNRLQIGLALDPEELRLIDAY